MKWLKHDLRIALQGCRLTGDHSFSKYAQFSKKMTFVVTLYAHVRVRVRG